MWLATMSIHAAAHAVLVTIFKFQPVSSFTELHALARSYALLMKVIYSALWFGLFFYGS